jgi:replicative DNA helicase
MVNEKLPPFDVDAEQAVLGACLVDAEALAACVAHVQPHQFFRRVHEQVFAAIVALHERGDWVNQVTVAHELARRDQLDDIGGVSFLSRVVVDLATVIGAEHYARIVARDHVYRELISAGGGIAQIGYEGGPDLDSALARAERRLAHVRLNSGTADLVRIGDVVTEYLAARSQTIGTRGAVVPTGLADLDALIVGMRPGDLILLAARPSVGKSSLAIRLARTAAESGVPTLFATLEMSREQVLLRLVAAATGLAIQPLMDGRVGPAQQRLVLRELSRLQHLPLWPEDAPTQSVPQLTATAQRIQQAHGLGLVVVDYLGLLTSGSRSGENRVAEISAISRGLKTLARTLNVPVLALSQVSRAVESRRPPVPMLSDLRDSGSLEQDADLVWFLYRADYQKGRDEIEDAFVAAEPFPEGVAQLIVAKHRNGPVGTVHLHFDERVAWFSDFEAVGR